MTTSHTHLPHETAPEPTIDTNKLVAERREKLAAIRAQLNDSRWSWHYQELDPDVFGEQLLEPGYQPVERIAAVGLTVTRNG